MPVGGGFGGKVGLVEPTVAALALAVGRPVRLAYTRMEEFVAADPAPESVLRVKIGARRDGTLTTLQGELIFDAGAKPGAPVGIAAILMGSTVSLGEPAAARHRSPHPQVGHWRLSRAGRAAGGVRAREPGRRGGARSWASTRSSCA